MAPSLEAVRSDEILREARVEPAEVIVAEIWVLEARDEQGVDHLALGLEVAKQAQGGQIEPDDVVTDQLTGPRRKRLELWKRVLLRLVPIDASDDAEQFLQICEMYPVGYSVGFDVEE